MRRLLIVLVLLLSAVAAVAYWLAGREETLQWALSRVTAATQGQLQFEGVGGNLLGAVRVERVRFAKDKLDVAASAVTLDFSLLGLLHRELQLNRVEAASVAIVLEPDDTPLTMPEDLTLPIAVEIDSLRVGRIEFRRGDLSLAAQDLAAQVGSNGREHALHILGINLPWGQAQAELDLDGRQPFALRGKAQLAPAAGQRLPAMSLVLGGNLAEIKTDLAAESAWLQGQVATIVTPFDPLPTKELTADVRHLDLQALDAALPKMEMVGKLAAMPTGKTRFEGSLEVNNRTPGNWSTGRVPLTRMATAFVASPDEVILTDLAMALSRGGALAGQARLGRDGLSASLDGRGLDLSAWHPRLSPTRLAGKIDLDADLEAQRMRARLADDRQRYVVDATRQGERVRVHQARVSSAGGDLDLTGELTLSDTLPFSAEARLRRFNPAVFGDFPDARINARLKGRGQLQPAWQVRAEATVSDSVYRKLPLSGKVSGQFSQVRVADSQGELHWGGNRIQFQGSLGRQDDQLNLNYQLTDLHQILPDWRGQARGSAVVSGDWRHPGLQVQAKTEQIQGPNRLRWQAADLNARLVPDLEAPLVIEASVRKPQLGEFLLDRLVMSVNGSGRSHRASLTVEGPDLAFASVLTGGLNETWDWRGQVEQFQASKPRQARLQAPAPLAIRRDGIELGAAHVSASRAQFHVDGFSLTPDGLRSSGRFNALPLAMLGLPMGKDISSDALLGGTWQVNASDKLNGTVKVWQEAGTWTLAGEKSLTLHPTRIRIEAVAKDNRLNAQGQLALKNGSLLDASLSTEVARQGNAWVVPGSAPLALQAKGQIAKLDWLGRFLGNDIATTGNMAFSMAGKGTWAQPDLSGVITGKDLVFHHFPSGVAFSDGRLDARMAGQELILDRLDVKSGAGRLAATGRAGLGENPDLRLHIEGEHLALLEHRDWDLDTHLKGDLRVDRHGSAFKGELRVNRGLLLLGGTSAPTLSSDVRIKGRQAEAKPSAGAALALDLLVDLGQDFQIRTSDKGQLLSGRLPFQTSGLRTKATGKLRLQGEPRQAIRANGEIRVVDGSYYLLGQRLDIERGNLLFDGPLNNPVLDISAIRETRDMKAGMSITGTALNPRARLFSEPEVPDQEKLSWLLFGRGGQPMDSSLAGTTSVAAGLTSFGFQLTDRLYVAYEQGTTGTEQFVNFYSKLSDRLSVEARTGSESALRLFYTFTLKDSKPDPGQAGKD